MKTYLDFEKPIAELEAKIEELNTLARRSGANAMGVELERLREKVKKQLEDTYANLDAWQKTQVARHPDRPKFRAYLDGLFTDYVELRGDRQFADDQAILGGLARFQGVACLVLGQEKGSTTQERLTHNFGSARPEGYRKAVRLMDLAERFHLPVFTFIDTAGAYPGIGAEERGQAEAIARSTLRCLTLKTPLISLVIGEGGSGGAVALAAASRVLMMEHAFYSVISPEGAAQILWKDSARAKDAANALKYSASDLLAFKVIDAIVPEPIGGAHRAPNVAVANAGDALLAAYAELAGKSPDQLVKERRERFLAIGRDAPEPAPPGRKSGKKG